jgi:hypothetical protein
VVVAGTQGAYFAAAGIWPLLDITSFQLVTGPKTDLWLVKTVGVLIVVIGAVLLRAARARRVGAEIALLGAGSALGLAAIDLIYSLRGTISSIYLLDAAAELVLVLCWVLVRRSVSPSGVSVS